MEKKAGSGNRFWCPRQGTISLNDQGFVVDPDSETKRYFASELEPLDHLRERKCLMLLGEPQSGKTCSVSREVNSLTEGTLKTGDFITYVDLSEYSDETRLIADVFRSSRFVEWLSSGRKMYLLLDQFDTCLISIPTLPALLKARINELRGVSSRLFLRIIARVGLWAEFLTEALESNWGKQDVGVYEIAPIGRTEVVRTAEANGLVSAKFIDSLVARELQPLAGHPLTLDLLLENYHPERGFTRHNEWLYLNCARVLCSNFDSIYHGQVAQARLSPARRLSLAARVAAALVFSNRTAITVDPRATDISETDVSLRSMEEGEETTGSQTFAFTETDMLDVLQNTALFSGRGPNRVGFISRSVQEFLAARYLALHQLSVQQIKALTQVSTAPGETVVPQLKQTVGWLSSIMPDLLAHTIRTDPKSILLGAVQDLESRFRRDLVESFLNQFENKEIADLDWGDYSQYHKLNHPEIAAQLRPFIAGKNRYFLVRRVAIDIAEACGVEDPNLLKLLSSVALDRSDDLHIREQAAHAVSQIGNKESRLSLKALLVQGNEEDTDDQLRGSALTALWPQYLTAKELFAAVAKPRRESFFGTYAFFLSSLHKTLGAGTCR